MQAGLKDKISSATIIGASGMLGRHLISTIPPQIVRLITVNRRRDAGLNNSDRFIHCTTDLSCPESVERAISAALQTDLVIWVAGVSSHVAVERDRATSRAVNVSAPVRIFKALKSHGRRIVFVSSEAVFGPSRRERYTELDEPLPTTEYGNQKREVELFLAAVDDSLIVRTGWMIADGTSGGCIISNTYRELLSGTHSYASDYYLTVSAATWVAERIWLLGVNSSSPKVCHLTGEKIFSRLELASLIRQLSKRKFEMMYSETSFNVYAGSIGIGNIRRERHACIGSLGETQKDVIQSIVKKVDALDNTQVV
jgi:dTDP-4-dehydrorhamnose reductase